MTSLQGIFLPVHGRHLNNLVIGKKTVELRRTCPRDAVGKTAMLYATSPRMELAASALVVDVISIRVQQLWRNHGESACVSRSEFFEYFSGKSHGNALVVSNVKPLTEPISLKNLRILWPGFVVPQSFCYLDSVEVDKAMTFILPKIRRRQIRNDDSAVENLVPTT